MSGFFASLLAGKVSLRLLLVVPFLLQIAAAVGLTGWLSWRNGQQTIEQLVLQHQRVVADRIQDYLAQQLAIAPLALQLIQDDLHRGQLPDLLLLEQQRLQGQAFSQLGFQPGQGLAAPQDLAQQDLTQQALAQQYLARQLELFPALSSLAIAPAQGPGLMAYRDRQGALFFAPLGDGRRQPRSPWYGAVARQGQPQWRGPSQRRWGRQQQGLGLSWPLYDGAGRFWGVAEAQLDLRAIQTFLGRLLLQDGALAVMPGQEDSAASVGNSSQIFLLNRQGNVIVTAGVSGQSDRPRLPTAAELSELTATQQAVTAALPAQDKLAMGDSAPGNSAPGNSAQGNSPSPAAGQYLTRLVPLENGQGLDWILVVALPRSALRGAIAAHTGLTLRLGVAALLVAILLGLLTSRWLVRPILKINQAANALARGDWKQRVNASRAWELDLLGRSFNRMASELEQSFHWLEYGAYHDTLTGLLNRNALQSGLQNTLAWRESLAQPPLFAVLFLDLDYFKLVNDSLGHLTGDQLLLAVAQRLKRQLRQLNGTCPNPTEREGRSLLARFGGDEFVIVLDPIRDSEEARATAQALLDALQEPFLIDEHEVFVNASLGVVISNGLGEQADSLLRNADLALYRAKAEGKSTLALFDSELHRAAVRRLELETDLRRALQRQELSLHYQPIVDAQHQQITGMEVLARWHHWRRGAISPSEFIPVAEETGMILKLGWWVLEAACEQLQDWRSRSRQAETLVMSVNLSSRQFFQVDCIERIGDILARTQVPPQQLKLEITESLFMYAIEETAAKLHRLRAMGLQLSIDDFGTGYSSLSYLHRFPLTTLKIDRSFICQLTPGSDYGAIVEAIVVLAHKLKLDVIAEGVETPEQLRQLQGMGCEQIQGFLFSPPLPAEAMAQLLKAGQPLPVRSLA